MGLRLRLGDHATELAVERWSSPATAGERSLLRKLCGPVLDLGCGPGRLVVALAEVGIPALGIDASPHAVRRASARGAPTLQRSIFDLLPREGRWRTVLLFDGNVGIGGDPAAVLTRAARLVAPDGTVVVEVEPPGTPTVAGRACIERDGVTSVWFPWARVSADVLGDYAEGAGLAFERWATADDRWFAILHPTSA